MQIRYSGKDKFNIKTGQSLIRLGVECAVDDFSIPGPGEYEKGGVSIIGIANDNNTIYVIRAEEINLCYLGRIVKEVSQNVVKEIGDVDVLFLPLGEEGTLEVKKAVDLLSAIDPRVVIPMLYADLSDFKKSEGITDGETETFKFKKSDLPEEERKIVILKPTG